MSNTHEWCAAGIEPQIQILQDLPYSVFTWSLSLIRQHRVIHVPRVDDLPEAAAAEKAILKEQSIQSLILVPLIYERKAEGFVGFDAVLAEKSWSDNDIALLRIVGEMLVGALHRKRSEEKRKALETQLIQARSLENVAKLAGGVAHDFNNFLGVILNYAALLEQRLGDPELRGFAAELRETATQAADLTRQLLIVGRRGMVTPVVLDLNEVLATLEHLLHRTLGENVQLELRLDETIGLVRLGRPHLEQVILNLAMNARDAMPTGGRVLIETLGVEVDERAAAMRLDAAPGNYTCLRVSDNGVGMDQEVLAHACEPFFTTRAPTGSGLGLSTAHSILRQAGGHLVLSSQPGVGTTAELFFPAEETQPKCGPSSTSLGPVPTGKGECIVVVEDCESLRAIICSTLTESHYQVLNAANPAEALSLCAQHPSTLDLLLTDVVMPGMSGRQLAQTLAEQRGLRRVAYISGHDDDILARQGVLDAGIRLLSKPFLREQLLQFVRDALDAPVATLRL